MAWDIAFVGGGFRTTTFLASAPQLLPYRIRVHERGPVIGPGGFARYAITTTSIGSRFVKDIHYTGPYEALGQQPQLAAMARSEEPVRMEHLAAALTELGRSVENAIGQHGVRRHSEVIAVCVSRTSSHGAVLETADGATETCRHAVLATGRRELPHPELARWREKVWLSGSVISTGPRHAVKQWLAGLGPRPIVIAGRSHSAMSALQALLDLIRELGQEQPALRPPAVKVLQRGPARLMYENVAEARRRQLPGRDRIFDPAADVCPVTGIVYRDSGLRHQSRALYCALWNGEVPGAELVEAPTIADAGELLDGAGLIVQALGYRGQAPDIYLDGTLVRPHNSPRRLQAADDGALLVAGIPHEALSALRVEPTPPGRRDNAAYASDLYRNLARRLGRLLAPATPAGALR